MKSSVSVKSELTGVAVNHQGLLLLFYIELYVNTGQFMFKFRV